MEPHHRVVQQVHARSRVLSPRAFGLLLPGEGRLHFRQGVVSCGLLESTKGPFPGTGNHGAFS